MDFTPVRLSSINITRPWRARVANIEELVTFKVLDFLIYWIGIG
jgi:hypothetical protein